MKNKDIISELEYLNCNRTELLIRFTAIFLLALFSLVFGVSYPYSDIIFGWAFLMLFVKIFLLWHGSMLLINFSIKKFSLFDETLKLFIFQFVSLFTLVTIIVYLEFFVLESVLKQSLSYTVKFNLFLGALLSTYLISTIYASVAFFQQWKINLLKAKELEKSNLEAQYASLVNQVNPHFLFNSFNALLVLVKDNPIASKYVESISEIMRYMLQSNEREVVTLQEELLIAEKYAFIQINRFGSKFTINFNIDPKYNTFLLPPLTLQMLLENVVKHNEISEAHPLTVNIYTIEKPFLIVENKMQAKRESEKSLGIGLDNIRKRYQHIFGEVILIQKTEEHFTVQLPLINPESQKK